MSDWLDVAVNATVLGDPIYRLIRSLPPGPRAFVACEEHERAMLKGRRAGGSVGALAWLLKDLPKGKTSTYIAPTYKQAYEIMWPIILKTNSEYGLGLTLRKGPLEVDTASGGTLRLSGCDDIGEAEKFRGKESWKVHVDEVASFPEELIKYLLEDVLGPTLADQDGYLGIGGTPGYDPLGYFYDHTDGHLSWPTFRFNCLSNPYINGARAIAREMKRHGWTKDHPTLIREWMGRWVSDLASLIYHLDPARHRIEDHFDSGFTTIGCDVGYFPDKCGFAVCRSQPPYSNELQVLRAFKRGRMLLPQIAAVLEQLMEEYATNSSKRCLIYIDTAGGSKILAETLREQYKLPCVAAYKPDKKTRIEMVRGAIAGGNLRLDFRQCAELVSEWSTLLWDEKRKSHSEKCDDDISDALLYAAHKHKQAYMDQERIIVPGTPQWARALEDADQERAEREQQKIRSAWN